MRNPDTTKDPSQITDFIFLCFFFFFFQVNHVEELTIIVEPSHMNPMREQVQLSYDIKPYSAKGVGESLIDDRCILGPFDFQGCNHCHKYMVLKSWIGSSARKGRCLILSQFNVFIFFLRNHRHIRLHTQEGKIAYTRKKKSIPRIKP